MHRAALLFGAICFILASAVSLFLAGRAVDIVERETEIQVSQALLASGQNWATIRPDGLLVHLTGLAPNEASRFQALEIMGQVIDSSRVSDKTTVLQSEQINPPRFSLEVLRNVDRISLIGLIPARVGRDLILSRAKDIAGGGAVTDMLESTEQAAPAGWARNLAFGLDSLALLPRSKISITPEEVRVTAVTESADEQANVEIELAEQKPKGMALILDISAPRPVISPFRFRMTLEDGDAKLHSCSADTRATRDRILRAVSSAGLREKPMCRIGLGVPTTDWDRAIILGISALRELGGGTLTFTDSDVALIATDSVSQSSFDSVIGKLENDLPLLFSLHAVLPPKILSGSTLSNIELPEFVATRSPEGLIMLRGRVQNATSKNSVGLFAEALFGRESVHNQTRIDADLPDGWPTRILAGLESLATLDRGAVVVQPETISIKGVGASPEVSDEISRLMAVRLGGKEGFVVDVTFDPNLVKKDIGLSDEECVLQVSAVLTQRQIEFSPSSTDIEESSLGILDALAEILRDCPNAEFVVEGHTDSQGSEELNKNLSQSRADSVVMALLARRVLVSRIAAKGFGEDQPIADNGTEDGRAKNRRIAFRLKDKKVPVKDTENDG